MARWTIVGMLVVIAALAFSGTVSAREVVLQDDEGRAMHFDVRADVELGWYAGLLRRPRTPKRSRG